MVDGVIILVTGDIAFSGKEAEYALAEGFLEDVVKSIKREKNVPLKVLMCPGNHDCDFESGKPEIRDLIIEKILKTSPDEITDTLIEQCAEVQDQFFAFQQKFNIEKPLNDHVLWQSHRVTLNGHSVLFHLLNVAWMSKQREAQGTIVFPIKRFEAAVKTASDATIVAFHHPLNWFAQPSYRPFRLFTRKAAHLILTGHEHCQAVAFIDELGAGENVAIDGGVLQGVNTQTSCFNLVLLNLETQEYSVEFHEWNGSLYVPKEMEFAWSSFRRLPEKKQSEFSITDDFLELLDNVGARFTHYGKSEDLTLDDVYIYPEMRPIDEEEKGRAVFDAAGLRSPEKLERGVVIRGREQYGKTSLLKQLFRSYHERSFVPVFLSGKELNKSTPRDIQKIVEKAVSKAYGEQAIPSFWQSGCERRVLLLDDLDDTKLSGEYFSKALTHLNSIFSLMVITCGEFFEYREYISPSNFGILNNLDHYTLLEFGHRRRFELIKRWANLGGNVHSPEKTIALIDQMEKLVTSVIGEGVVPSTPFFMLTLLQTLEAGSPTDLQHSALGDYYRYLIIHSLEIQHVRREEHAEILNYCAHLAWFVSQTPSQKISTTDFRQFHHQFIERHGLSLDFTQRNQLLTQAKLFEQYDDGFGFVFPYLHYFFLGKYLADHLDTEEINEFIRKCCLNLHKTDCSNTILFLAHHSRDRRVYEGILLILQTHFAKYSPVNLDNDVDVVNRLVKSTPNLIYVQSDPLENRIEIRSLQDKTEAKRQEVIPDSEPLPPEVVSLISLLKTIDILGQFLKNHYGQLEAQVKEQLIKELFDGTFRGLRYFLELLVENSEWLIQNIENVIEKRGLEDDQLKKNVRAKKVMFELLGMVVTAFIRRGGISVASPHLSRIIERVILGNPTTIYRLVFSAIDLEYQGGLKNLSKLRGLNQDIKNNSLAQWILRQLVLAHMHLYSTTYDQKQQVCAELDINIHNQRVLELETKDSKRVAR